MSLIEVLTSLLIFSIGILGLVGLQTQAIQYSMSAEDSNRAALLANDIAAVMWTQKSVTLTEGDYTTWQKRVGNAEADGLPNGQGEVTVDENNVATITITWRPPKAPDGSQNRYVTQVVVTQAVM